MPDLGVIILAAGGSTRMGQPKQQLEINGQTLIRKMAEIALAIGGGPVFIVLGNAHQEIQKEIIDLNVEIVLNPNWKKGMASSLRIGVAALEQFAPELKSVLILLSDQPLITVDYLNELYLSFKESKQVAIASEYETIKGVPAIFEFEFLRHFIQKDGDFGARYLIKALDKEKRLAALPFPEGAIDLDTQEDYERFLKMNNGKKAP